MAQNRTLRRAAARALAIIPLALAAGCASTPEIDAGFGDAVRQSIDRQVIDPSAGLRPAAVPTLDAGSARAVVERYRDSHKAPPPSFEILNIGGAGIGR